MKVTLVSGSPGLHGVSATLAKKVLKVCEAAGATVEIHNLNQLIYKACQGCLACKKTTEASWSQTG